MRTEKKWFSTSERGIQPRFYIQERKVLNLLQSANFTVYDIAEGGKNEYNKLNQYKNW